MYNPQDEFFFVSMTYQKKDKLKMLFFSFPGKPKIENCGPTLHDTQSSNY